MRRFHTFGSLVLLLSLSLPALASAESPRDFVKEKQTELTTLIKQKTGGNTKKIEAVFDSILDYDALARGSLGEHWNSRTEAERQEFQQVLKQLVQRAYRKNLDRTVNYQVQFEGESHAAEQFVVRTVAQSRTNAREEPIAIDYVLHRAGPEWRIQDIVTEGSSLVGNYRQQFNRIIKKDGFPELLRRMKGKLASS